MREPQYPPNLQAALDAMRAERPDLFRPAYNQTPGPAGATLPIANHQTGEYVQVGDDWVHSETLRRSPEYAEWAVQPERGQVDQLQESGWLPQVSGMMQRGGMKFPTNLPPADTERQGSNLIVHGSQGQTPQDLMRILLPQFGSSQDLSRDNLVATGVMPASEGAQQAAAERGYQAESLEANPNATAGGVVDTGLNDAVAEGDPNTPDYAAFVGKGKPAGGKKKSNYGEFFALLRRMKSEEKDGKKDTRKALKQLAKQLSDSDSVATKGNATGQIEV